MKKSLVFLISVCGLSLLSACGGGSTPPPPATHFSLTTPGTATAGTAFSITVTALDASNTVATSYAGIVHFTSSDAQATLPANSTLTNGVGNLSATLKTAGGQTITATDATTPTITGTSSSIIVSAGAATHFSVTAPAATTTGTAFSITVTALDASNNTVANYSGTVHFTSTDAQAVLPANSTLTNGVGNFSATLETAGGQTITAADTNTASITGTSSSISVTPGHATHFSLTAPGTATAGTAFNFTVTALDASNNMATGYSGTAHFASTDSQAVLPANSTLVNGTGTFSATLKTVGSQTINATDTANASISGTSNSIKVGTTAATHFGFTTPVSVTKGTGFNFQVTALDAANNLATGYSGTVQFTSTDTIAVLPANSMLPNGTGSFSATLNTSGKQTITATDTVTTSITGASKSIGVFTNCGGQGANCNGDALLPCCPGLTCTVEGNRSKCEPEDPSFLKKEDRLALLSPKQASRFTATCTLETARESHTATLLTNGLVLIAGGDDRTASLPSAELFNPDTHSFASAGDMAIARAMHTATLLANGVVLVIGGRDLSGNALAAAEIFDPDTMSFTPVVVSMRTARESHTATLLTDGKVLITGGDDGTVSLATAELFDRVSEGFAPVGSMGAPRVSHTATLLKDGRVLVTGGRDSDGNVLATAELFDPGSRRFTPAGTMHAARELHTATLLSDGKVLITGGDNGTESLRTAELFDPANGKFAPTGDMHEARELHTATLRNDGTVLVAGGASFASVGADDARTEFPAEPTATAELFDPANGSFTPTSDMSTARARHAAISLPNGEVLVTGGINNSLDTNSLKSAELFR